MFKQIGIVLITTALAFPHVANANDEKPKLRGTVCDGTLFKLTCGYIGEVTVPEIYEKGWRIIAVVQSGSGRSVSVIIEEQETKS
ncbi:hypothetical protein [Sapientia aquatica]|uniref:DUF2845 domain-containing protein n=1 Tax=Sapientia aquatica TaxID=1549640 RepID=A0A4R5VTU9_9BURK|nr:hypothetical protein [Sapientia aquatica]TDK61980.1 hypothetical protein E2I14_17015 [Sapientia aquatica]